MGAAKRCLKMVICKSTLHFEKLPTLLVEVEGKINARPITYVYIDKSVSPAELVYGYMVSRVPNDKRFEVVNLLGIREVLSSANQFKKPDITVGAIVIVENEQSKRQFWRLAREEELIVSKDGIIHSVKIRFPAENGKSKVRK